MHNQTTDPPFRGQDGTLSGQPEESGWQQREERQVTVGLLTILWQRWAPTLDWAAAGMVLILIFFVIARISFLPVGHLVRIITNGPNDSRFLLAIGIIGFPLLFLGGWLALLMNRQESKPGSRIAKFLLPWRYNFRGATAGSLLVALGVWLGGIADTWYGMAPTMALAGLSGMALWGSLRPPQRAKRHAWSGRFAVALLLPALIGWLYLATQPHNWWHQVHALAGHNWHVKSVPFSPDGQLLASTSCGKRESLGCVEGEIRLWERDGTPLATLEGHTNWVSSLAWSPDGELLASASNDDTVRLWGQDGTPLATLEGHTSTVSSLAWSPDGQLLASASNDTVRLWGRDGTLLTTLEGHTDRVSYLAWSPDGQLLASAGCDKGENRRCVEGEIRLWARDGTSLATLEGHRSDVSYLAWSPDGELLASAGGFYDDTVRVWRRDGTPHATLEGHTDRVNSVAWSPDGQLLASASCGKTEDWSCVEGEIRLWERDGTRFANLETLEGHIGDVNSVAWSPDGELLASASWDGTARLWGRDGTPLATLEGHTSGVESVDWSPDGELLASAGDDGTVRLWWVGDWWWK